MCPSNQVSKEKEPSRGWRLPIIASVWQLWVSKLCIAWLDNRVGPAPPSKLGALKLPRLGGKEPST
jgi:hypothetical protein